MVYRTYGVEEIRIPYEFEGIVSLVIYIAVEIDDTSVECGKRIDAVKYYTN